MTIRIKTLLKKRFPEISNRKIGEWLDAGLVRLAGRPLKPTAKVEETAMPDVLADLNVYPLAPDPSVPCRLLHKTRDYYFLEKAPGVPSVALDFSEMGTVANWLIAQDDKQARVGKPLEAGLVHRLDTDTSGVMVAARSAKAHEFLTNLFREHKIQKDYVCLVSEEPPALDVYEDYAGNDPKSSKKVWIQMKPKPGMKKICTQILQSEKVGEGWRLTIRLVTGFRHQIRAHLAYMGCPIDGDMLYRGKKADRLMLHAHRLAFEDKNGEMFEVIPSVNL
jgi:23S rRNA pseudouridine1911/1915/1917 synthase